MLFLHPHHSTMANIWLEQRLHVSKYFMFSWKPVEVTRKSKRALLGCIDPLLIIGKESGNSGAKSESPDIFVTRSKTVWGCFSCYYFSLYCLFHLLPFRIAAKESHLSWESLSLLILQTRGRTFQNANSIYTYKLGWLLTGCYHSMEVSDVECTCWQPEFGSFWYWGIFSSSLRNL